MKTQTVYRQGDVLITPVNEIPSGLKKTKRVTLALGEATGHHHTINYGAVGFAEKEDDLATFFSVEGNQSADLTHQEHDTITLPPGKYKATIQVEYTPEAIQRVAD